MMTGYILLLLIMLTAIGPLSTDLYLPALPNLRDDLGVSVADAQLTLSLYMVAFAISQIIYGPISDRYGRRPAIIIGLIIFILGCLFCSFAPNIEMLYLGRIFQALGGCAGPVVARAIIRDCTDPKDARKYMGIIFAAMAMAPVIAPSIGGLLTEIFNWRINFIALMVLGFIGLFCIFLFLPETNLYRDAKGTNIKTMFTKFGILFGDSFFMHVVLISTCTFSGLFAFLSGSSFVFIEIFGLTPSQFGICFMFIASGFAIGAFTVSRVSWRSRNVVMLGLGISLISVCTLMYIYLFIENMTWYMVLPTIVFFLLGFGFSSPSLMAASLENYQHMSGSASSLYGVISQTGAAICGFLVGHFYNGTIASMALGMFIPTIIACLIWLNLDYLQKRPLKENITSL